MSEAEEAVKRIKAVIRKVEGIPLQVICRGGEICKIPAQIIKCPEREGVITTYEIPADVY